MKNLLIISLLSLLSLSASSQQYGWTDISENVPQNNEFPPGLSDVFFVSDSFGWITTTTYSEIFKTTNGGESFSTQTTPLGATSAIHMLNGNIGYSGGQGGWVYTTSDGGLNWNMLASMSSLSDISFPFNTDTNNPIGYACGDAGRVWEITSTLTDLNTGLGGGFNGISAPSVDHVWVCGGGRIYYYNGTDFTSQIAPTGTFNDIHFIDDQEGWVVGDGGVIGNTTDGGNTWNTQTNPDPHFLSLSSVFFLDSDKGWAVGNGGIILQTTDGGNTWTIEGAGLTTAALRGIHFTSATNGYIVGNEKTLLKYSELTGIADDGLEELAFELYPNPCQDKIQISNSKLQTNSTPKTQHSTLMIVDIQGRVVYDEEMGRRGEGEMSVDVSHLPPGLYLVKLQTEDGVGVRKIIKK